MTGLETRATAPRRIAGRSLRRAALPTLLAALLMTSVSPSGLGDASLPKGEASPRATSSSEAAERSAQLALGVAIPQEGVVFIADPGSRMLAERGGRVARTPLPSVQAKFAAGSLLSGEGLIGASRAKGDREMRTALAGPGAFDRAARPGAFRKPSEDTENLVADAGLKPSVVDMAARRRAPKPAEPKGDELSVAAAYAPEVSAAGPSLFDSILKRDPKSFVPPIGADDHSWAASVLPASAFTEKEQTCLATAIYFEARGESELGQAAVAQVVLNRVRNPTYPKTICGVVYQNQHWRNRCQFSFACDGIPDRIWNKRAYETAERIAHEVSVGETWLPEVGSATHYHATYVNPRWARTMKKVDKIGLHIFYRTFGGGWS